jgi:hypothetical protein
MIPNSRSGGYIYCSGLSSIPGHSKRLPARFRIDETLGECRLPSPFEPGTSMGPSLALRGRVIERGIQSQARDYGNGFS